MTSPVIEQALASFVASTNDEQVPDRVLASTTEALTTVLDAAARGVDGRVARAIVEMASAVATGGDATVLGTRRRLPAADAACANAAAARGAGSDGPLAVIVLAALSVAESTNATLVELCRAVSLGREIATRATRALGPAHVVRGYDLTGTAGRLGGAVAAAAVFSLDESQVVDVLGFAATMASGGASASSSDASSVLAGRAASDAVDASYLAAAGLSGPPAPLTGRRGMFALESSDADPELLVAQLGPEWIAEPPQPRAGSPTPRQRAIEAAMRVTTSVADIVVAAHESGAR